jgi:hypothetical protein
LGWEVPECHFEMKASKKGRPKKDSCDEESESDAGSEKEKKRGRPKKEQSIETVNVGEDLIASLILDSKVGAVEEDVVEDVELGVEEVEEEDETSVVKMEINGITYLISDDKVLYDLSSHDCVGIWNEETQTIDEVVDEDDEEDEEDEEDDIVL